MIMGTLDDIYPNMVEILLVSLFFIISILSQTAITSILLEHYNPYRVYTGYYSINFLISFITAWFIFGEVLIEVNIGLLSLILGATGAFVMTTEKIIDNKLIQEI